MQMCISLFVKGLITIIVIYILVKYDLFNKSEII